MTLRVLIADDEQAARHGMLRALKVTGCELLEAADGEAALVAIRDLAPDLVFLDLNMPGRDGLSVLRELSSISPSNRPPCEIIVVTANDQVGTAVECMRLGAADYLTSYQRIQGSAVGSMSGPPDRPAPRREHRIDQPRADAEAARGAG